MTEATTQQTLSEVVDINPESLSAATPGSSTFRYIDLRSVNKGDIDWNAVQPTSFADAPSRARRVTQAGDVLFGTVRPSLESHGVIPSTSGHGEYVASTGFAVLRARSARSSGRFLYHFCFSQSVRDDARRMEVGSNYPAVNESDIKRFSFPRLTVDEQLSIAQILDVLDDQIRATKQLIGKHKLVKQGLVRQL